MALNFTAIDFETANGSSASACSVGLVKVRDGRIVDRASWLIRPPYGHDSFNEWNIRIHGIHPSDVVDAKLWSEQQSDILDFADGDTFVAHNVGFDMGVMRAAATASRIAVPETRWTCSLQIARKTYSLDSYRLPVAAMAAGFEDFHHHDAADDAEACASIIVHAAGRHDAADLEHLAKICSTKIRAIGPAAEEEQRAATWWR
ncbi:exonuclease domain-containing protein [Humidisolicoccus flavus]|uniref:exonuclease domain-containing protein n=1 Tax=Humidisolicoccus flavus TaxID=3111414 RepID=UPI00324D204A